MSEWQVERQTRCAFLAFVDSMENKVEDHQSYLLIGLEPMME